MIGIVIAAIAGAPDLGEAVGVLGASVRAALVGVEQTVVQVILTPVAAGGAAQCPGLQYSP